MVNQKIAVGICALFSMSGAVNASRQTEVLTSGWKFIQEDVAVSASSETWNPVTVPHTWNALDAQNGSAGNPDLKSGYYRGACWYVRNLEVPADLKGRRVFIRFEAASIVARVYLNGALLGEHRGAFTAFCFELTSHLQFGGVNELRVQVDNSHFEDVPPLSGDFNLDGGIYRPVQLIVTGPVCITPLDFASSGVYLTSRSISKEAAQIEVKTLVSSGSAVEESIQVESIIKDASGKIVASSKQPVTLKPNEILPVISLLNIENPHRWDGLKDPYLYTTEVQLIRNDQRIDLVVQPLGVKTVKISEDRGFLLNDQPYPIHGVSRHQDRKNKGWALSPADHEEDAHLILDMGVTAVRNAHYPQSEYWHQLADRSGLLLWDEVPMVNDTKDTPEFAGNVTLQLEELVHQLYNHPSIAFWGIFNELVATANTDLVKQLKEKVETLDRSRIIVGATCRRNQTFNQVPEALCFNQYPGWYEDKPEDMALHIDHYFEEFGHRRVALSEYGAGGNAIQHQEGPARLEKFYGPFHPQEWQSYVHEVDYAAIKDNPKIWGSFVWVMFDFGVAKRWEGSQIGINDKGIISYDRQTKKDVFYFYQANWSHEPVLYIASQKLKVRQQDATELKVYSNAEEVELIVNGKALPSVSRNKVNVFYWKVVGLKPGKNVIEARGRVNGKEVSDRCEWFLETAETPLP